MSGKFGSLSKLGSQVSEKTKKLETTIPSKLETEEPWEALGTELRRATKRRLKAYAGQKGRKVKELVEEAITAYLDAQKAGKDET